ncbi:MAG TPA: type I DNA topoisomerase [Cyanobacteria bacterium UBA8530]|nr:type I DNA topoisomerase [Cyanobacteria bacterium UBA8530]
MAKSLVIVESPAKAKTIEKILGKDFQVKASTGHVRDLPKKGLGVEVRKNFSPKYEVLPEKTNVVEELKEAARSAVSVFLAPDPDREGEAIAWHLAQILEGEAKSLQRIEFNEITKDAILNAIKSPREIDQNRVDAQQARRVLDRLVGYKISPLLWYKVRRGLSAGRVQSVAVRLICDREEEVLAFVPKEYWSISASLQKATAKTAFSTEVAQLNGKKIDIGNQAAAEKAVDSLQDAAFSVKKVTPKEQKRQPSPPYITSTLQQEGSRRYGFSVKRTMALAQQLYEGIELGTEGPVGLITYMRTDSVRVAQEAQDEARGFVTERYGKDYIPAQKRTYPTKKGAQDAHEAIRPSSVVRTPESMKPFLTPDQNKLYRLIWERFLASQMANAVIKVISVEIDAKHEDFSALLRAADSKVVFPGFQAVYTEVTDEEEVEKKSKLPELTAGEALKLKEVLPKQHFTQAPPRFTEASLVKTLEEKGIGRPSTYAPTISTIIDRGYVEREAKTLKPTELGLQVNEQLVQHFPTIVDIGFTADLENKLDAVEAGEQEWQKLIAAFYKPFQETLKIAAKEMKPVAIPSGENCETCGQPLLIKTGRFGEFLACSGYPECKTTKPLIKKLGVTCRAPECTGDIIIKRSRTGKTFYACSRYPECTFTSWDPPTEQVCPKCSSFMVQKRATKTGRTFLLCSNVECKNILNVKAAKKEEEAEGVEK